MTHIIGGSHYFIILGMRKRINLILISAQVKILENVLS